MEEKKKTSKAKNVKILSTKVLSQLSQLAEDEKKDTHFKRLKEQLVTFKYMEDIAVIARDYKDNDKGKFLYYAYQLLILLDKHEDMLHKHAMEREQLELDKKRMKYLKERLALDTLKTKALYQTEDDDKKQDIIKSLDEKIEDFFGNPQKDEKE